VSGARGRRAAALALACAGLALAASCGPRPTAPAPVTGGARGARYLGELLRREDAAAMADADVMLWARVRPGAFSGDTADAPPDGAGALTPLPALRADLLMGWPDALRLRFAPLFGVALDVAAWGDSVVAYAPGQRSGLALDAVRDSLGAAAPGRLLLRLWSAAWRPPEAAWRDAAPAGDLVLVRWVEAEDSVAVALDANGRPAWARLARPDGRGVRVTYERWELVSGVGWPMTLRVEGLDGSFTLTSRVDHLRFEPKRDDARLRLRLPPGAKRLDPARLGPLLEMMGGAR